MQVLVNETSIYVKYNLNTTTVVVLQVLSNICIYILKWAHQCPKDQNKKFQSHMTSPLLSRLGDGALKITY